MALEISQYNMTVSEPHVVYGIYRELYVLGLARVLLIHSLYFSHFHNLNICHMEKVSDDSAIVRCVVDDRREVYRSDGQFCRVLQRKTPSD